MARDAAPCTLMEELFGAGAQESLRGRAGVACRVISGGEIALGDTVDFGLGPDDAEADERAAS